MYTQKTDLLKSGGEGEGRRKEESRERNEDMGRHEHLLLKEIREMSVPLQPAVFQVREARFACELCISAVVRNKLKAGEIIHLFGMIARICPLLSLHASVNKRSRDLCMFVCLKVHVH